ncbi:hypothetical protein SAMN05192529_101248 [Arachidicoccus rhizosphaerae]|uniref:Uncharacterized protein n=1 Tax=Arachidicoccus rhizosphaerae TaxID=551991 RepID=A0A1H3VL41_9BACT|nr:hypothetical protein [Arachidicoccus rhizosphaerae]SDZ75495.1 hypothetical protein SAMN05192529_101248 [Arachidicoccus rhizosphaerae]
MKTVDIILTGLYDHFIRMKKRRRKIVPWFETCSALAFAVTISFTLMLKIVFNKSLDFKKIPEYYFLLLFLSFGIGVFVLSKSYYFRNDKHIKLMDLYLEKYSEADRKKIRYFVTIGLSIFPFFLMFIMWLQAFTNFWQGF